LLVDTNDILAIGLDPNDFLTRLNRYFMLKLDSIHSPDDYLATNIKKTVLTNGKKAWGQRSLLYINNAVSNLESWMKDKVDELPKRVSTPIVTNYQP
jgi:hypothetical protein